jgi:hypothetical protein
MKLTLQFLLFVLFILGVAYGIRQARGPYIQKLVPESMNPCDEEKQPRVYRDTKDSKWPIERSRDECDPDQESTDSNAPVQP